jgi:subtilisin-like proprotein convertase family protein
MLLAAAGLAMAAGSVSAQVYSASPALASVDFATKSSQISIGSGPSNITDLNVIVSHSHTWDADLDIVLQGPGGYICLSTDNGGSGDNYQFTRFDDAATMAIAAGNAPFFNNFRPEGLLNGWTGTPATFTGTNYATLAGFNGSSANGLWTMYIADDASGDSGIFSYWSLEFNGAVDPNGPPPITAPTDPTITGFGTPNAVVQGRDVVLTATVVPGTNPASTNLSVVAAGGIVLLDDGMSGDGMAGDNVFGGAANVGNQPPGITDYEIVVTDGQGRTGIGSIILNILPSGQWEEGNDGGGDAGELPGTAQVITGPSGPIATIGGDILDGDTDMYAITICDPSSFSADMTISDRTDFDTQLWLFDANGRGVEFNDDTLNAVSAIDNTFVTAPGQYYLAVTGYNRDALDASGALLWNNQPFTGVRSPNGPGSANAISSWSGTSAEGSYLITLGGVCIQNPSMCDPDVNQDGNADQGDVDYLINVVAGGPNDTGIDPDFNQDGNVDQGDIDALINVVAGGACP